MKTIKTALMAAGLLALFACSSTPAPQPQPQPQGPPPREEAPPPRPISNDRCGAEPLQYLVGRPKTEIPVPVDPSKRRVTCTSCPVTMDYREDRLNIFFDAETGIVKDVKCG
jgi:hypothetical protein